MSSDDNRKLAARFHDYFNVELATTQTQKDNVFKIRYRVYCDEFRFLNAEEHPDQLESDEYDAFSQLCLITHKGSGLPAACVRIVPAMAPSASYPLPCERLGPDTLDRAFVENLQVPRESLCEISRLAVDGAFRRRTGEATTRFGEIDAMDIAHMEKRTFGLIAVAAFLCAASAADLSAHSSAFAMMEPFLPRLMQRSGIHFQKAGADIDYHGLRAPYFIKLESFLEAMHPDLRGFYESIHDSISASQ